MKSVQIIVQGRSESAFEFSQTLNLIIEKEEKKKNELRTMQFTSASDGRQTCNLGFEKIKKEEKV